jgi:hypothetical protein
MKKKCDSVALGQAVTVVNILSSTDTQEGTLLPVFQRILKVFKSLKVFFNLLTSEGVGVA